MARPKHEPLDTMQGLRDEMIRLYSRAKAGKLDAAKLGKLIYALNSLVQITREIEVVDRLEAIEAAQEALDVAA